MTTFLNRQEVAKLGPRRLVRATERLLWHLGFSDIRNIDGPGDEGGDLLAQGKGLRWVFQCKSTTGATIDATAIRQADSAKAYYSADRAVVVTNARAGRPAQQQRQRLATVGVRIDIWSGATLTKFGSDVIPDCVPDRYGLRRYQRRAVLAAWRGLTGPDRRALVVMATGLGKTVVAGEVVERHLRGGAPDVLVVAHTTELVAQLERAMWRHVPKSVLTHASTARDRPSELRGVICGTVQSAISLMEGGWRPSLLVVDEAHHVAEEGMFDDLLAATKGIPLLGMTATPWRGDGYDISERFGPAVFTMGIAEGMAAGFLAQVDYRLFVDGVDWEVVAQSSEHGLSIRDLNERLFLPQRDESVVDELRDAWATLPRPRAIVFCRTIDHAEEFAQSLRAAGWRRASPISNRQTRRERDLLLSEFADGRVPIITAVDIFNEGVDVPDVNILCFLRVTHSRRIFVQQLGRGLRLRTGKESVRVLDFVSDVRRIAATLDLQRSLARARAEEIERLTIPNAVFRFSQPEIGTLLDEWIKDAAALEDAGEEVRLQFPEGFVLT